MSGITTIWNRYRSIPIVYRIGVAFVLGTLVGLLVGEPATTLRPFGDIFLRLLQMLVIPIIVATLLTGVQRLSPSQLGRVGGTVVGLYMVTTAIAAAIGLTLANLLDPGAGAVLENAEANSAEAPSVVEVVMNAIPTNPLAAMVEGNLMATIFFVVVFGVALALVRDTTDDPEIASSIESILQAMEAVSKTLFKLVWGVMEYGVIGVFALMAASIGGNGVGALFDLAMLVATIALAIGIHIVVTYLGIIVIGLVGESPLAFLSGAKDAMVTAFSIRSSSGTLPVTMTDAEENLGIDERIYSFSLPLGATANMDGAAIRLAVTAVFAANVVGQSLALGEQVTVLAIAVLVSIGTAGVPGAGLVMLTLILNQLGLPLEIVGLVAGVDAILGRIATMNNVTGDLAVTTLAAKWHDAIDFDSGVWAETRARIPGVASTGD
ncbi:Na+/H+-dicarboxylate symporter [Halogranum amylolyticum]|uniref:Na+/H+-dicarboxylate symporter n=1 Tax=Halogranum amylolyticum TaxID=660520 RepID=A0A1H8N3C1_9EURY|nr:dicarboxylate/amino acid:cation symporter [Halogranum amylolyticum]SEO24060.1 Na+/H+-dicarboxylate symporter [Halogranum amylolyticum]